MSSHAGFYYEKITAGFLALMSTVFLLGFGPGGYTDITATKYLLFVVISCLYLLSLVLAAVISRVKGERSLVHPLSLWRNAGPIRRFLLCFLLFCLVSAVLSPYGVHTIIGYHRYEGIFTIALYVLTFIFVSLYGRPGKWLLFLFAASMTVFSLICFCQFLGCNPFGLYPQGLTYYDAYHAYRYQYLGTIGNVDLVAALLAIAAPIFFLSFLRLPGKSRYLLLIPLGCVIAVTILSRVAAAYVAVFGGLLFLIPLAAVKTRRHKYIAWILILLLIFGGVCLIFCMDYGEGTFHELHELLHGRWDEDFGTGRLFIWRNVLALVPERPFFGGGPDTLGQRMIVDFQRYDAESGVLYRAAIDTAHNEYLNILVNEGVLALAAYLAAFLVFLVTFGKENRHNDVLAICGSAVFCYGIQAFFGMRMCLTAPFFWLCWALAVGALKNKKACTEKQCRRN